ncbi:DUF1905 domain-containing protein [Demequina aurantiaca]|uniref:DUF1905 domain-containing protein n=1 Tax=Demequina aurantiaca TaxID=676200 RepID=UPI003D351962
MTNTYEFEAPLWQWTAQQSVWMFVTLPENVTDEIDDAQAGPRAGFGSVKVRVRVGATTWETSIFPSQEMGGFILPVKKAVRLAEKLDEGTVGRFELVTLT